MLLKVFPKSHLTSQPVSVLIHVARMAYLHDHLVLGLSWNTVDRITVACPTLPAPDTGTEACEVSTRCSGGFYIVLYQIVYNHYVLFYPISCILCITFFYAIISADIPGALTVQP